MVGVVLLSFSVFLQPATASNINAVCLPDDTGCKRISTSLVQKQAIKSRMGSEEVPLPIVSTVPLSPAASSGNAPGPVIPNSQEQLVSRVALPINVTNAPMQPPEKVIVHPAEASVALVKPNTSEIEAGPAQISRPDQVEAPAMDTGLPNATGHPWQPPHLVEANPLESSTPNAGTNVGEVGNVIRDNTSQVLSQDPANDIVPPPVSQELNSVDAAKKADEQAKTADDEAKKAADEAKKEADEAKKAANEAKGGTETLPSEDDASSTSVWNGINDLLRGKPQALGIFLMMLLPAGMCTIMYCVYNLIRLMEDGVASEDASLGANAPGERRLTLGEVMQPNVSSRKSQEPLCPELMAPSDNVTLIALPSLNEAKPGPEHECTICQKTGTPIVRVTLTRMSTHSDGVPDVAGGGSYGPGQTLERISLVAHQRSNALGFCELSVPTGGSSSAVNKLKCNIYRPTGDLFATLEEEPKGVVSSLLASTSTGSTFGASNYVVTTVGTNARYWIKGDIASRNLVVVKETDNTKPIINIDSGENLQFAENSNYYRLRVQPKVDAGVFIMALLAIDRLPGSHRS